MSVQTCNNIASPTDLNTFCLNYGTLCAVYGALQSLAPSCRSESKAYAHEFLSRIVLR